MLVNENVRGAAAPDHPCGGAGGAGTTTRHRTTVRRFEILSDWSIAERQFHFSDATKVPSVSPNPQACPGAGEEGESRLKILPKSVRYHNDLFIVDLLLCAPAPRSSGWGLELPFGPGIGSGDRGAPILGPKGYSNSTGLPC